MIYTRSKIDWEICEISDGRIHRIKAVGGKLCVYNPPMPLLEWKKLPQIQLSKDQQVFLKAALAGNNIFLTGKAGTGKSFVVKHLIELLKEQKKKVAAIAPTGIAANNIGGQTIHSMFGIAPFGVSSFETANFLKSEKRRMLNAIDTILIDEVSMLRPDILDAMNWTLLKNGCKPLHTKQLIFIGDLKQLPPVLNDNTKSVLFQTYDGENFFHAKIYSQLRVQNIELKEILRQSDPDFIDNLNLIREGEKAPYFKQFVTDDLGDGIILAPYNSTVEEYNQAGLAAINGKEFVFTAKVEGNVKADEFNVQSEIRMKNGAKIMYLMNSTNGELVNGTLGVFVSHSGCHYIRVGEVDYALSPFKFVKKEYVLGRMWKMEGDKRIEFGPEQLMLREIGSIEQYPIRLAYALSIHKSQGLTFDSVSIDITRPCFMPGMFYVAVSRVRTPEGLKIKM